MEQLDNTIAQLAAVNARIEEGQAARDVERAKFEALMAEHQSGIEACEEAISLIASLGGGGSFIQLKGRIKSVSKKLTEMTKLGDKFEAYAPLISSLAEIASKAEPNVVTKILDLLRELKAQIETTRAADEAWE